jgi:hypothetical protein
VLSTPFFSQDLKGNLYSAPMQGSLIFVCEVIVSVAAAQIRRGRSENHAYRRRPQGHGRC